MALPHKNRKEETVNLCKEIDAIESQADRVQRKAISQLFEGNCTIWWAMKMREFYALPGVAYHPLTIEPTVIHRALALQQQGQQLTAQDAVGLMQETYRCFVHDNAPRFAQMFRLLLDNDSPIVFHCTAGKDRTGFAAALILLALGVPRATVMEDYLLTNGLYRRPEGLASLAPSEVLAVLWRVQEDFLDAALHRVDADFGGIDTYLVDVLGLDDAARKELAQRYLQTL